LTIADSLAKPIQRRPRHQHCRQPCKRSKSNDAADEQKAEKRLLSQALLRSLRPSF
jgi:hypothetical protein